MNKTDELAEMLFVNFQKVFPLADEKRAGKAMRSLSEAVFEQRLDRFYAEAKEFRKTHGLWVLNWARVVLKLQQRLLEAGYPLQGVKPLLLGLIINSSK